MVKETHLKITMIVSVCQKGKCDRIRTVVHLNTPAQAGVFGMKVRLQYTLQHWKQKTFHRNVGNTPCASVSFLTFVKLHYTNEWNVLGAGWCLVRRPTCHRPERPGPARLTRQSRELAEADCLLLSMTVLPHSRLIRARATRWLQVKFWFIIQSVCVCA